MALTFTQELEAIVARSYKDGIVPQIQERAPQIALDGLIKLREEAKLRADVAVFGYIDVTWMDEPFREELLERVREHVPVDVQIFLSEDREKIKFKLGKYRAGYANGKMEYDFPSWGMHGMGVRHNLSHLKEKRISGKAVDVFDLILGMFGCLEGDIDKNPGDFGINMAVEILDRVLTWTQQNASKALSVSSNDYLDLFACMAAGADNLTQIKSVDDARAKLFSPK